MSRLGDRLRGLRGNVQIWIAARWDGPEKIAVFLSKPLPRNVSWLHTLGSLLLLYIGFQTLTGILLGLYYSPTPQSAYASVRFVRDELFLGRFLHHLHRFGASFVIVTAFLHLARSYFLAAYKPPRELLWLSGIMLFALLTLFAFTGQLLPFDQRGYWATIVGIRIASSAPVLGDSVRDLLTGGFGDIGATTLARFYILHVCVLPIVLFGLIGMHLALLQKVGSAGPTNGSSAPVRPFYPSQAVKDVLVAAVGAIALCLVAALVVAEETGPANPASGNFVPRPEWFFLSHYEILRMLPGRWQILGTFVLPNAVLILLVILPFIDRKPERSLKARKFATAVGALACLAIVVLTARGIVGAPDSAPGASDGTLPQDPVARGRALFTANDCIKCHTVATEGGTQGPDLSEVGRRLRADYLPAWIRNPRSFKPDTEMPAFEGSEDELEALVEYLLTQQGVK